MGMLNDVVNREAKILS